MSYLEQYDNAPVDKKVELVTRWIRTDWRPFFKELRENRPLFVTPKFTFVTLFKDVQEVLSREEVFTVKLNAPKMDPVVGGSFMLARDNTEVNWREKSIMQTMLQREELPLVREMCGKIADESLDKWTINGKIEVVNQLGRYVPVRLCGDYFGFPGSDMESMYRWSKATQSDMFKNLQNDTQVHEASVKAGEEMRAYLAQLLQDKKEKIAQECNINPSFEDTFTRLIKTQFPKDIPFDEDRIITNMAGLLVGSVETASQAIVQALEQILLNRTTFQAALQAARDNDNESFDKYVWEALRFNPINPLVFRYCEQDYTLASGTSRATKIEPNTIVFACTASAMFDASELTEPETFSIERPKYQYMHFGYGHHTCLGKYIGLVQIPEVIKRVLLRPNVRLIPGKEGQIDFQNSSFPEHFVIAYNR